MPLAFDISSIFDFVYIPFAFIFTTIYSFVSDYGLAIILFALLAKVCLLPIGIKGEKTRLKTMRVQPKMQALQAKYKGNSRDPKYQEELQKLYEKEGYSPFGGCLPQLIQLPIIWAIWNAIRNPLTYIVGASNAGGLWTRTTEALVNAGLLDIGKTSAASWVGSNQIHLASVLSSHGSEINVEGLSQSLLDKIDGINLNFMGFIDLGAKPSLSPINWYVLIPVLSALTSFLVGFISQKINTPKNASEEENKAARKSMSTLLYVMPLISLWIGFQFSAAIGLYWIFSNVLSLAQTVLLPYFMNRKQRKLAAAQGEIVIEKKLNYNQIEKMKREEKNNQDK